VSNPLSRLDSAAVEIASSLYRPRLAELALQFLAEGLRGPFWLLVALVGQPRRSHPRSRPLGSAAAAYGCTLAAEILLKKRIHRRRPNYGSEDDARSSDAGDKYSFPSGHAMGAFAGAVTLSTFHPSRRPGYLLAASVVSASRVYLGIHYPSDVLAGALIGAGFGGSVALMRMSPASSKQADRLGLAAGLAGVLLYFLERKRGSS
jgi:undecaprenyl-diphosphatase